MKSQSKLAEKALVAQEISIGPNFCGPRPPALPKIMTKIDHELGLVTDFNSMAAALNVLYEAAEAGDVAASEELRLLSLRAVELADQFAMPTQKVG